MKKWTKRISVALVMVLVFGAVQNKEDFFGEKQALAQEVQAPEQFTSSDGKYTYQYNEDGETITLTKYYSAPEEVEVTLPKEVDGLPVTGFAKNTFGAYSNFASPYFEKVIVPGNYKKINSFGVCHNLKEITFQKGVKQIEDYAFDRCKNLEKVTLSESVIKIGTAFSGCDALKSINLPSKLKGKVNLDSTNIKKLKVPKGVTKISLENCLKLQEVILPKEMKDLGDDTFSSNWKLKKIVLPENIEDIGENTFSACVSLKKIELPAKVTRIYQNGFTACRSLKEIDLSSVKRIDHSAFFSCESLKKVTFGNLKVLGDSSFSCCNSLTEVVIPGTVRMYDEPEEFEGAEYNIGSSADVGAYSFAECKSLKNVVIKEGVRSIGKEAFAEYDALRSITIPKTVKKVGKKAIPKNAGKTVIRGEAGSWIEKYAKKNGYKFRQI